MIAPAKKRSAVSSAARSSAADSPVAGIVRVRIGRGFRYERTAGGIVRSEVALERIRKLAIPPAWESVWISADSKAPLQATGRDARGRKQYRYHAAWRAKRERAKFSRLPQFPDVLRKIRRTIGRDLRRETGSKRQVLATVVRLLEETLVRVGNAEYARDNESFGLTTLKNGHAKVVGNALQLRFNGKGGKWHDVVVVDGHVARTVRRCQRLPGELFVWTDETGDVHDVNSADVNAYLREISGEDITAKDFRTWAGSLLAVRFFRQSTPSGNATPRVVMAVVRRVAEELRNTPAVCRKSYIHPRVIAAFERTGSQGGLSGRRVMNKLSDEEFLRRVIRE